LTDAKDLVNCSRENVAWSDLLKPRKTQFLMEEVEKQTDKQIIYIQAEFHQVFCVFYQAFSLIGNHLSRTDILNSRNVCSYWRNGVDSFLQNHPAHYDVGIGLEAPPRLHAFGNQYTNSFLHMTEMQRIVDQDYENFNPYAVSRHLSYHEDNPPERGPPRRSTSRARGTLVKLVKKVGSELWHLDLSLSDEGIGQQTAVRACLAALPNLKTATILVDGGAKHNYMISTSSGPPPFLNHLVKLDTNVEGILNYVRLEKNNQMQKLRCTNLSQGTEMKLLDTLDTTLAYGADVNNLGSLIAPQLKILKLDAKYCSFAVQLPLVFRAVSKFGSSLRYFSLDYQLLHHMGREIDGLELTLPLLQTLRLNVGNNRVANVDFLLGCVKLEHLFLESSADSLSTNEEKKVANQGGGVPRQIQVFGFENNLYQSNIWVLFPKLMSVEIKGGTEFYAYTQQGYRQ